MNANFSSQIAETSSAARVGEGPFEPGDDPQPNLADIGRLPATIMVPPRRSGMFAVIQVDAREARLVVARLASDGSFRTVREECESFGTSGGAGGSGGEEQRRIAIAMADILSRFQRDAELLGATVRAVATQSFRTLPNFQHLLRRLPRVTRVALQVISDREVARFVCLGALRGRPPGRRTLVVDVAEDTTSLILADAEEPLALWRLAVGSGRFVADRSAAAGGAERARAASWRRQVQEAMALGHLHSARGAASEAVLIRPREANVTAPGGAVAGNSVANLAAVAFVGEIASYLQIRQVQSTDAGLHDGILVELSRGHDPGPRTPGLAAG